MLAVQVHSWKILLIKKKMLWFYFLHSSYYCILGNARSRPGAIIPEAAIWILGRFVDFALTACFAEILYSSLPKYRLDEWHDTAAFLFMLLFLQKLIVTPVGFPIYYMTFSICFFLRQQFMFRKFSPENLIFHNFFLVFIKFIYNNR